METCNTVMGLCPSITPAVSLKKLPATTLHISVTMPHSYPLLQGLQQPLPPDAATASLPLSIIVTT